MKRKFSKILGVGLALVLALSLAAPVMADVSSATVDVTPDEISDTAKYTINFRPGDELDATDTITIRFPDDTAVSAAAFVLNTDFTIAASPGWIGGVWTNAVVTSVTASGNATDREVTLTLGVGDKIGESATVRVVFLTTGTKTITSPSEPGAYTLEVKTSEETTYVDSESYDIDLPTVGGGVYIYNASDILVETYGGSAALDNAVTDLQFAKDDFTIRVEPGTYLLTADIVITGEDLTFRSSEGAEDTIIDANELYGILINEDGVTIDGFTIDDADVGVEIQAGALDAVIENCFIKDADGSGPGVKIATGDLNAIVQDNEFDDCPVAIELSSGADDATISRNTIGDCTGDGAIVFKGGNDKCDIIGNAISGNDCPGIYIEGAASDDNVIEGNTISENEDHGIHVNTSTAPTELIIRDNVIIDNTESGTDGIRIEDGGWSDDNAIIFNTISGNASDNIQNNDTTTGIDVYAIFNWWGSAASSDITAELNENPGNIIYEPWCTDTPDAIFSASDVACDDEALDAKTAVGVKVAGVEDESVTPKNAYVIAVGKYIANPGDAIDDAIAFWDVYIALDDTFDCEDVTIRLKFYDDAIDENSLVGYWTGDFWTECFDYEVVPGVAWVTVSEDTIPAIEDLEATPFVVITGEPAPEVWGCPQCGLVFDTEAELDTHWDDRHATVAPEPAPVVYTCAYDGLPFDTRAELVAHLASAHPPVVPAPPEITIEAPPAPDVTIEAPAAPNVTVEAPEITVEQPNITVEPALPFWAILAIIIIGAVLLVAMIVLIYRTRRVA